MNKRLKPNPAGYNRDNDVEHIYVRVIQRDCRLKSGYNAHDPESIQRYSKMLREYPTHTLDRLLKVLKSNGGDVWERPDVVQDIVDEITERVLLNEG